MAFNGNSNRTADWKLYEAGKTYNNQLKPSYYDTVDANIEFHKGNQWRNLEDVNMPTPVFNIMKRVVSFFVASLTTTKARLHFEPLLLTSNQDPKMQNEINAAEMANNQVLNLFEKFKMDFKIKDILFDGAITGDGCFHFYFDMNKRPFGSGQYGNIKGEICLEIVDGTNVFFGNANTYLVEDQPYIVISGRDTVKNLQEEAKLHKTVDTEINNISSDTNNYFQAGDSGKIEVKGDESGKALYIIVYRKKKIQREKKDQLGNTILDENKQPVTEEVVTITATKSVENAYIYQEIDTGLSEYPVAWFNWERQKGEYHGRAVCTGILPNQIFINRMFSMIMYHLMLAAFPKAVFNADLIQSWNNEIGAAIPVKGLGHDVNIGNIAGYLEPGNMSNQITQAIDMAMAYTKECLGINDASLGNIDNPSNTSGVAIIATQKSAAIPLENPKSNLYEFIEDVGKILFDFIGTYYGIRPIVIDVQGQKQLVEYDFSTFKNMFFNVKADVGESSYWSEIAAIQTLDNLLAQGHIDLIQYLERVPDEYIPAKEDLISELKQKMNDPTNAIAQLNPQEQQAFYSAPPEQQQAMLAQLKQSQQPPNSMPMQTAPQQ